MTDKFPADHLSASFIAKYEQCPLAAKYYREGKPAEQDRRYLECGSLVHSVIERYYNPSAKLYEPLPGTMDSEMEQRYSESVAGFEQLVATVPRLMADGSQTPEVRIQSELCGVPFLGFIDLLTRKDGKIWIDDWKTGAHSQQNENQIRMYTLLISRMTDTPIKDITATLDYVREIPSKRQRIIPFTSEKAIEYRVKKYVVDPIWAEDWHPKVGAQCARCEYRRICEAKRG